MVYLLRVRGSVRRTTHGGGRSEYQVRAPGTTVLLCFIQMVRVGRSVLSVFFLTV